LEWPLDLEHASPVLILSVIAGIALLLILGCYYWVFGDSNPVRVGWTLEQLIEALGQPESNATPAALRGKPYIKLDPRCVSVLRYERIPQFRISIPKILWVQMDKDGKVITSSICDYTEVDPGGGLIDRIGGR
jgi:hypothetical protein